MTFKATEASSGLTISLSQAPLSQQGLSAGSLRLYQPRQLHNIRALHVLTLHVCCTLFIVAFLFIWEILFSAAWYEDACNSTGYIPTSIVPRHFNRLIQGIMYLRHGRGGQRALKENGSIKASIIVEGWTERKEYPVK